MNNRLILSNQLLKKMYDIMACNDPKQVILTDVKKFLDDEEKLNQPTPTQAQPSTLKPKKGVKRLVILAAVDNNGAISKDNGIPWRLKEDMRLFKANTLNGTVLMGRKTAESIGKALPNRRNLVLTRGDDVPFDGQECVHSFAEAIMKCEEEDLLVIGGGEVYTQAFEVAMYLNLPCLIKLTHVDTTIDSPDTYFPSLTVFYASLSTINVVDYAKDENNEFDFQYGEIPLNPGCFDFTDTFNITENGIRIGKKLGACDAQKTT